MTNTHRKTTNRTTAKIAAVGAFGLGAAIAFPGLAAAQEAPSGSLEGLAGDTGSLTEIAGEDGSLGDLGLGTDLAVDLGSLAFNLNLDAEASNPGSVELGSLGVSPNTGSALIDGGAADAGTGSLDTGSLTGSADEGTDTDTGSLTGSADEGTDTDTGSLTGSADEGTDTDTGSLTGELAGLSSGAEA
uniref:hypothetical protein n=1 Tax=Dietzia sp. SYD-A1 TaxID=2780141 RepID=UPI001E62DACD